MPRSDYEFFVLLLNRAAAGAEKRLHQNPEKLHTAFYRLKTRYGEIFPSLGDLHFITAGAFPYSPDLTEAFDVLQFSGASSKENPSYEMVAPKRFDGLAEWLEESDARITGDDADRQRALRSVVDELREALSTVD